jgi:hypothetical protein
MGCKYGVEANFVGYLCPPKKDRFWQAPKAALRAVAANSPFVRKADLYAKRSECRLSALAVDRHERPTAAVDRLSQRCGAASQRSLVVSNFVTDLLWLDRPFSATKRDTSGYCLAAARLSLASSIRTLGITRRIRGERKPSASSA